MFRFFSVCAPLFDTDSIGSLTGERPPVAEPRGGSVTCEFCESSLSGRGEVLKMSTRARELRTVEDRFAQEIAAHAITKAQLATAATRIAELEAATAPPAPKASKWGME